MLAVQHASYTTAGKGGMHRVGGGGEGIRQYTRIREKRKNKERIKKNIAF
jgi:hypothetical protein